MSRNENEEEIEKYLKDKSNIITFIDITNARDEALSNRIPHLERLNNCYIDIIDILEDISYLPLKVTNQHFYKITLNYFLLYDYIWKYMYDFSNFSKFAFNQEINRKK